MGPARGRPRRVRLPRRRRRRGARAGGPAAVSVPGGAAAARRHARRAGLLVATPRAAETLGGIHVDVLVGSGKDRLEQIKPLDPPPRLEVWTRGAEGGEYTGGT